MSRTTLVLLAFTVLPAVASAQADTTRRRDTTRTPAVPQSRDSVTRVRSEARGETDLTRPAERFGIGLPNYGFSTEQASELQQALGRAGCDVGTADGVVGQRTLRGIECFRGRQNLNEADFETVLTALNVSFARPAAPVPAPAATPEPPRRDTTVLPVVLRPDSNYRPDVRARRDSARRDSTRRDSVRRDSTARRDSARRDTTKVPRQ